MDENWMRIALAEARLAAKAGEVPVGAVVVADGVEVARGHNRRERDHDPTAHAEIVAIRAAAAARASWRLDDAEVFVTLEPCVMCAGALVLARVSRIVFGADDPKAGAVGALYDIPRDPRLNHRPDVTRGVLAKDCGEELQAFFASRRT